MSEGKSSISKASSYQEIGEFWDTHDLSDYWEKTHPVDFEVNIEPNGVYYSIDIHLAAEIRSVADRKGVSSSTLLNSWIREKLSQESV